MGQIILGAGSGDGAGDGMKGRVIIQNENTMFTEIYGLLASLGAVPGHVSISLTTPTITDLDPGSGFPTGNGLLDLTLSANDVLIYSLKPGTYDGQRQLIKNLKTSAYNAKFQIDDGVHGTAAWRISGAGTLFILAPGFQATFVYNASLSRWTV